jgi:hypothetical protein
VQSSPTLVSPSSAKPCTWASLISHVASPPAVRTSVQCLLCK